MQVKDLRRLTTVLVLAYGGLVGCRAHQYGHVVADNQADMVGSHAAGAETYNALVSSSVAQLLCRHEAALHQVAYQAEEPCPQRVCFVNVENCSAEDMGDFRNQVYELIDAQILESPNFEPISRRYVDAALRQTRLRPDALFLPENMRTFSSALEQQGQPFDYLLYAKLTSGTTDKNRSYQRDYLLTLELINVHTGKYDKQSAKIRKGYHKTRVGKWSNYNLFNRWY